MTTEAIRQYHFETGPLASGLGLPGSLACVATTNGGTGVVSLVGLYVQTFNITSNNSRNTVGGLSGNFLSIYADTASVGLCLAPTLAGLPTPSLTAAGTFNSSGIYTPNGSNAEVWVVPAGMKMRIKIRPQDAFMAYVGGGSGYLRLYLSNSQGE